MALRCFCRPQSSALASGSTTAYKRPVLECGSSLPLYLRRLAVLSGVIGAQPVRKDKEASAAAGKADTNSLGRRVYLKQCAACHGANGEGTKRYNKPLTGSRSSGELGTFIAKSMPPGPRKC